MYILYSILAVWRAFGTSFSVVGPGLSARIRCKGSAPDMGKIAITNIRTPMPPIQWVKLRQNSMPLSSASTLESMLPPVVVKPEIDSKRLSKKDGIAPLITNGSAPNKDIITHDKDTVIIPSLA